VLVRIFRTSDLEGRQAPCPDAILTEEVVLGGLKFAVWSVEVKSMRDLLDIARSVKDVGDLCLRMAADGRSFYFEILDTEEPEK